MQERLIEIIVFLLGEFEQPQSQENYKDLSKELILLGYSEGEINLAFSWIFNHMQDQQAGLQDDFSFKSTSNRVLHDVEKMIISPEAYGYILQMRHLHLLTDYDIELVIERALTMGTSDITIDDIKSLTASMIFGSESNTDSFDGFFYPGSNTIH